MEHKGDNMKKQLSNKGMEKREELIADLVAKVGKEQAEAWLNDADKLSIINAIAEAFKN